MLIEERYSTSSSSYFYFTQAFSPTAGLSVGNTAVIFAVFWANSGQGVVTGVADTQGNTWTVRHTYQGVEYSEQDVSVISSTLTHALTTSDTITITIVGGGTIRRAWWLIEYDSLTASPFDAFVDHEAPGAPSITSGTLAQADELVFAILCSKSPSGQTSFTPSVGQTDMTPQFGNYFILTYVESASTSPVTLGGSWQHNDEWQGTLVGLKVVAAAPAVNISGPAPLLGRMGR